jgi:two-component sensor histidine kinase
MKTREWLEQRFQLDGGVEPECWSLPRMDEERTLAQAIVDTICEPLLILDNNLRVVFANRAFYHAFKAHLCEVQDRPFNTLLTGQWNIPNLKLLLANILPHQMVMEAYQVEADVAGLGRRTLLLHARTLLDGGYFEENDHRRILLTFEDITARRVAERETEALLCHKEILFREMQHRVGNSLQIIASILLLKARNGCSDDTRPHLEDAYRRILSVAAVQQHLDISLPGERIKLAPHLSRLCKTLEASMVGDDAPVTIKVLADGSTISSAETVSIGLIVTELVINALKHAFVADTPAAQILVAYDAAGTDWRLTVSDNGIGTPNGGGDTRTPGLGTSIVDALARQLDSRVERSRGLNGLGTSVSITHGPISPTLTSAAQLAGLNQIDAPLTEGTRPLAVDAEARSHDTLR